MSDESSVIRAPEFRIEPAPERGFVIVRVVGKLTAEIANEAQQRVSRDHPGLNRLWDFTAADLTAWGPPEMRRFIEAVLVRNEVAPGTRVGSIVSRDVEFGLARMFASLAEDRLAIRPAVFRDEAAAIVWITAPPEAPPLA